MHKKTIHLYLKEHRLFHEIIRTIKRRNNYKKTRIIDDPRKKEIARIYLNYKVTFGEFPDIVSPKTYNEKMTWTKMFWRSELACKCADKVEVKNILTEWNLSKYLCKTYFVFDNVSDFLNKVDLFPEECVIKTNSDSGSIFIKRKDMSNKEIKAGINRIISGFYKKPFVGLGEWVYADIKPKILVEELIKTDNNKAPADFKFFCFNGEPEYLFVGQGREDNDISFDFYDKNWNWIDVRNVHKNAKTHPEKPDNYDEMLQLARQLSCKFSHVRVDLYNVKGKIYFGELTFFHYGGDEKFNPESFDFEMGKKWNINNIPQNEIIPKVQMNDEILFLNRMSKQ